MSNERRYVLSSSYNSENYSSMYVNKRFYEDSSIIATVKLSEAMIFKTRDQAREQKIIMNDSGWQIEPTTNKKIFEARLKGK